MTASPIWIFDLDNTLHDANQHAFPVINRAMTHYLASRLGLSEPDAGALRLSYWRRYGATLHGLLRHHPEIDPLHFLDAAHPLDILAQESHPMPGLRRTLLRLSGHKYLFTNGTRAYGQVMLEQLGITDCFMGIFGVEDTDLAPKPAMRAYRRLLDQYQLRGPECIMVEDSVRNLLPAKRLGMRTVWLRRNARHHAAADITIRQLSELVGRIKN